MDATCAPQNASKAFVAASSATQQTAGMVPDVTDQVIMSGAVPAVRSLHAPRAADLCDPVKASASQLAAAEEALLQAGQADFMNGWNANSADLSKFEVPSMLSQLHPKHTAVSPAPLQLVAETSVRPYVSLALHTVLSQYRGSHGNTASMPSCPYL